MGCQIYCDIRALYSDLNFAGKKIIVSLETHMVACFEIIVVTSDKYVTLSGNPV